MEQFAQWLKRMITHYYVSKWLCLVKEGFGHRSDDTMPDDEQIIDAKGRYVFPGLRFTHAYWYSEDSVGFEGDDANETWSSTPHSVE